MRDIHQYSACKKVCLCRRRSHDCFRYPVFIALNGRIVHFHTCAESTKRGHFQPYSRRAVLLGSRKRLDKE